MIVINTPAAEAQAKLLNHCLSPADGGSLQVGRGSDRVSSSELVTETILVRRSLGWVEGGLVSGPR